MGWAGCRTTSQPATVRFHGMPDARGACARSGMNDTGPHTGLDGPSIGWPIRFSPVSPRSAQAYGGSTRSGSDFKADFCDVGMKVGTVDPCGVSTKVGGPGWRGRSECQQAPKHVSGIASCERKRRPFFRAEWRHRKTPIEKGR